LLNKYFSLNLPKWCWFVGVLCKWLLSKLLDKRQCYRRREGFCSCCADWRHF